MPFGHKIDEFCTFVTKADSANLFTLRMCGFGLSEKKNGCTEEEEMEIHSSKDELNLGSVAQNVKEKELNKLAIFQTVTFITEPL